MQNNKKRVADGPPEDAGPPQKQQRTLESTGVGLEIPYQERITTVSELLQSITRNLPTYPSLPSLTLSCFPYFLCFESWVVETNQPYRTIVQAMSTKFIKILTEEVKRNPLISVSEMMRRLEPLYYLPTQTIPNTYPVCPPPRTKTKTMVSEEQSFTCFELLPTELQQHIISFIDSSQWQNCVRVNKVFQIMFYHTRESMTITKKVEPWRLLKIFDLCPRLKKIQFETPGLMLKEDLHVIPTKVQELKIPPVIEGLDELAISRLASMPLTSLEIEGLEFEYSILSRLLCKPLPWKRLALKNVRLTSKQFIEIMSKCELTQVESLDISGMDLDKEDLLKLLDFSWKALKELNLSGNVLDQEIIVRLSSKLGPQLHTLKLCVCLIDHNDVKVLCQLMPNLEVLELGYSRVNPSSSTMANLVGLKKLKRLQLRGWPVVRAHVVHLLANLPALEELDVQYCGGVHQDNYDPQEFPCEAKVLLSQLEGQNLLAVQMQDIIQFAKKIQTLPLCRLFFPPLSRVQHRDQFVHVFRDVLKLIDAGWKRYLVSPDSYVPTTCKVLSRTGLVET